jgi:hypothetical protein
LKTPQFILVLRQLQHAEQINHGSQGYHSFGWYFLTKYNSGDQIKEHKMGMACGMCGENRNAYRSLVGTCTKENTHRRPRIRWDNNVKIDFEEMGWKGVPWIQELRIGTISRLL